MQALFNLRQCGEFEAAIWPLPTILTKSLMLVVRLMHALQALFNLGNLQRQCGEFEAAIRNYEGVLAISPDHWRGLLNYSVALVGISREEEAKRALRKAFKLSGAAPSVCL
jgi:Flp pilus assembly protein TadD